MPKVLARRGNKYAMECKKAYDEFNYFPYIYGVKMDFIPPAPKYYDIDNYNKPKEKRKFTPIELPEIIPIKQNGIIVSTKFKGMTEEEEDKFLEKIYKYRTEGYWFYNGDKLEYITGDHWYYLNIVTMPVKTKRNGVLSKKVGKPMFIDADRDFFLFWRKVELDMRAFGMMFVTSRRKGKALDINTPIPTPSGFKKLKDIFEGDYVFGKDGKPARVEFATDIQYNRNVNRVWFDDNTFLDADDDHLWEVTVRKERRKLKASAPKRIMTTKQIKDTGLFEIVGGKKERVFHIDINNPVEYSEKELPIDPYVYGYWLGDGNTSGSVIHCQESDLHNILNEVNRAGIEYNIAYPKNKCPNIYMLNVRQILKANGWLNKKIIPEIYKTSSIEQRKELLRGFMDADGYTPKGNAGVSEITQKHKHLIEDLAEVIRSLGEKCVVNSKKAEIKSINFKCTVYRLTFNPKFNPHKLKRKADNWQLPKSTRRKIKSIEKIEQIKSKPVKCIGVESEGNVFLAGKSYTVTHNSFKALSILLNAATSNVEANCGIQAQRENIAKSLFKRLVRIWQKIPQHEFLSPTHAGQDTPSRMLEFRKPSATSKKTQLRIYEDVLDSWIDYRPTTSSAYDSEGMFRYYIDEASKLEKCDLNELYNVARETLSDGSSITGKMLMTSTAEDLSGKTLLPFEKMWEESNYQERNRIGQTASGLIRYFQSAAYGYRHDAEEDGDLPIEFRKPTIDEFGYSDVELAEKIIRHFRASKKGNDLIQYKRKYPLTEEEAFAYGETYTPFDDEKLREHELYNQSVIKNGNITVRGNFEWKNGVPDTEVIWIPHPDGMWELYKMPHPEDRNKYTLNSFGRTPTRNLFNASCDPYSHEEVEDESRMSFAASHVIAEPSNDYSIPTVVCEYHGRRVNPNDFFEDMIKQCVFYSMKILIENQKQDCINHFRKRGYRGYILKDPYKDPAQAKDGISTTGENSRNSLINNLAAYIADNLGKQEDGNFFPFPFMKTLRDMRQFNQDKWTKNDLTVSLMIALAARIKLKTVKPKPKFKLRDFVSSWSSAGISRRKI